MTVKSTLLALVSGSLLALWVGDAVAQTQKCYFGECEPKAPSQQSAPSQIPLTGNPYSDQLARLSPDQQAAKLGVTCAGADSYMIQITPNGQGAALICQTLKAQGHGRECYRTF